MAEMIPQPRLSRLVLRGMLQLGFDQARLGILMGRPVSFVGSVLKGAERLRPQQLRRLEAAAGLSLSRLALLGMDRSKASAAQLRFLSDTERLLEKLQPPPKMLPRRSTPATRSRRSV